MTPAEPRSRWVLASLAVAAVAISALVAAQSLTPRPYGGTSQTSSAAGSVVVVIPYGAGDNESLNFQPASMIVVIGVNNTIVWNDLDAAQHTVTSVSLPAGAARFDSGILNQGQTFSLTLTVPGTYRYYCTIHPTWMRGTIIVKQ